VSDDIKAGMTTLDEIRGPCVICGATGYPLSLGGPEICPSCDCGDFGLETVQRQRNEISALRERAERERDAWRQRVAEWIDMIENCAGVPQNPDSLPQMLLHEMRKLTPSERESTPRQQDKGERG
jgi:hypothetical protein